MLETRSPIHDRLMRGGCPGAEGARTLSLGEVRGGFLLQLGAFRSRAEVVSSIVRTVVGCGWPTSPAIATVAGNHRLYRIARDQCWIATADPGLEARLAAGLPPGAGTLTPLSGSRTRLIVEGSAARAMLARVVTVDLRPDALPVGAFVQTGIHHVGTLLERPAEDRYEMLVLRTYAASIWDWLEDAARPFGFDVRIESVGVAGP